MLALLSLPDMQHSCESQNPVQQEELASASLALDAARTVDAECKRAAAEQDSTVSGLEAELAGLQAAADKQAVAVRPLVP